jgi:hypothetical protein
MHKRWRCYSYFAYVLFLALSRLTPGWAEVAMPRLSPQGAYPENGTFSPAQPGLA